MRFPVEIVRRARELVGGDFPIIYRISLLDLVEDGQTWEEVVELAHLLEDAGVTVLNTGIGWHEARVPTIITQVPRAAWVDYTARLKAEVSVPVCASNRINTPEAGRGDPRLGRGRPDLDGPAAARRRRVRQQGRRGPRRRDQHLHRLQPGLPRPRVQEPEGVVPGQPARLPRDDARAAADPGRRSRSPSSAPGRPVSPPRSPPPSADSRSRSSRSPTSSAASSSSRCRSPARRTSATRSATTAAGSRCSASTCGSASRPAACRPRDVRRRRAGHRRQAADPRDPGRRPPAGAALRRGAVG